MFLKEESNINRRILQNLCEGIQENKGLKRRGFDAKVTDEDINRLQEIVNSHKEEIQKSVLDNFKKYAPNGDEDRTIKNIEVYHTKGFDDRFSMYIDTVDSMFSDEGGELIEWFEKNLSQWFGEEIGAWGNFGSDYEFGFM